MRSAWQIADSLRTRLPRRTAVERPGLEVESRPVGEVLEKAEGNCDIVGKSIAEAGFQMTGNVAIVFGTPDAAGRIHWNDTDITVTAAGSASRTSATPASRPASSPTAPAPGSTGTTRGAPNRTVPKYVVAA